MNYISNIIINGDLNVDLLRENNNKLLEIISEFNLTNVIKELTRNGAPIIVSNLDIVMDSEVISVTSTYCVLCQSVSQMIVKYCRCSADQTPQSG
jgi:hypothetical protein